MWPKLNRLQFASFPSQVRWLEEQVHQQRPNDLERAAGISSWQGDCGFANGPL